MSKNIRGWRKINGEMLEQTAARWPQNHQFNLGFRLVHGNVDQVCRGGCGNYDQQFARGAGGYSDDPALRSGFLGFRLVWGRT